MSDFTPLYVPAADTLGTLELVPLPETCTPLEAIVLVKALDENGNVVWFTRETEALTLVESIGALNVALAVRVDGAVNGFLCDYDVGADDDGDI